MRNKMNCLQAQKRIRAFLDGTLPDSEMEAFLVHMDTCRDCREELQIYYTVDKALMEDEKDLREGWEERKVSVSQLLRNAARKVSIRKWIRSVQAVLRFVAGVTAAVILLTVLGILPVWHFWELDPPSLPGFGKAAVSQTEMITEAITEAQTQLPPESGQETQLQESAAVTGQEGPVETDEIREEESSHE